MNSIEQASRARARQSFYTTAALLALWAGVQLLNRNYAAVGGFGAAALLAFILAQVMSPAGMSNLLVWFEPKAGSKK